MAIEISYSDPYGVQHPAAYARIVRVELGMSSNRAFLHIGIYADKAARDAGKKELTLTRVMVENTPGETRQVLRLDADGKPVLDEGEAIIDEITTPAGTAFTGSFGNAQLLRAGNSPLKNAYAIVKTHPEFAGGRDV